MDETEFVNVAIRIRPGDEHKDQPCLQIISKNPPILLLPDRSQTYLFDQAFDVDANQETVYEQTVKPFVKYVQQGYNCTVLAYGQTGTGKTYTIGTESQVVEEKSLGLIPRTLREFFTYGEFEECETDISVSFTEIYNEKVYDLLQINSNQPLIVKGARPQEITQEKVYNLTEARQLLNIGNKNRHTGGTKQNAKSSRSHAIFTIHCHVKSKDKATRAKLNLVDLAGCESVKKTGNQGTTFHEGVNINKGLLSISQVMLALSTNAAFIPYRQSMITSLLQDSLNKRNFIYLIACVSSLQEDTTETLQTLDFAQRLKKVKSRPEVNEVLAQFKKDNPVLFQINKMATPFKRPLSHYYQTPAPVKRFKPVETTEIEMNTNYSEQSQSPKSLLSVSGDSSVSCINQGITRPVLSPIIKKYMYEVEASLMDKMEVLLKSTLKHPSCVLKFQEEKENKNSTPNVNWTRFHSEVSKVVQSELSRLTTKPIQATSTPSKVEEIDKIKKVLNYDNPASEIPLKSEFTSFTNDSISETVFKVPELPAVIKKNMKQQGKTSISPIETIAASPRRSLRLSVKKMDTSHEGLTSFRESGNLEHTLTQSRVSIANINRRKSVRLAGKNNASLLDDYKNNIREQKSLKKRNPKLGIQNFPVGKSIMKKDKQDSPCTAHTKNTLNILQIGSLQDLEKLQLIGAKTAERLMLFRKMKGNLNKISDLMKMPGWGERKFSKFVEHNFLKKELL